jgi:hypothetical protein
LCAWKAWFAIADAFCDFSIRETASVALGPLPPGAPPVCEMFRHYPDALERATELDAQYGSNSPLDEMPMYGVVFSFNQVGVFERFVCFYRMRSADMAQRAWRAIGGEKLAD